jgi:hypothetical protein
MRMWRWLLTHFAVAFELHRYSLVRDLLSSAVLHPNLIAWLGLPAGSWVGCSYVVRRFGIAKGQAAAGSALGICSR